MSAFQRISTKRASTEVVIKRIYILHVLTSDLPHDVYILKLGIPG